MKAIEVFKNIEVKKILTQSDFSEVKQKSDAIEFSEREIEIIEPESLIQKINDIEQQALVYMLNPKVISKLYVDNLPLRARVLYFSAPDINWCAGGGWPTYSTYCPRNNTNISMRFPKALVHQIVPQFGGFYWTGCNNPAFGVGTQVTDVLFSVNDDSYDDNTGFFKIVITNWSS